MKKIVYAVLLLFLIQLTSAQYSNATIPCGTTSDCPHPYQYCYQDYLCEADFECKFVGHHGENRCVTSGGNCVSCRPGICIDAGGGIAYCSGGGIDECQQDSDCPGHDQPTCADESTIQSVKCLTGATGGRYCGFTYTRCPGNQVCRQGNCVPPGGFAFVPYSPSGMPVVIVVVVLALVLLVAGYSVLMGNKGK